MFRDSSDNIEEFTTSVTGFITVISALTTTIQDKGWNREQGTGNRTENQKIKT
jgi:hypothetical protein